MTHSDPGISAINLRMHTVVSPRYRRKGEHK